MYNFNTRFINGFIFYPHESGENWSITIDLALGHARPDRVHVNIFLYYLDTRLEITVEEAKGAWKLAATADTE